MEEPEQQRNSEANMKENSSDNQHHPAQNLPDKAAQTETKRSRLKVFNKVMEKSLQRLVTESSYSRFSHFFHPLCKQNPAVSEVIHKQFITDLHKSIQEDINRVIEEGDLQLKLDQLDKLEEAAKDTADPAWRPSGVPEQDVCGVLVPYHQVQEEYVRRELRKLQKENAELAQRVQAGREAITRTERSIASAVEEWKDSVADLESFVASLCPSDSFESL